MTKFAITGGLAVGKSTTLQAFAAKQIPILNNDSIVHDLYTQPSIVSKIVDMYGEGILSTDRLSINRQKLLDVVPSLDALEKLTLPLVNDIVSQFHTQHQSGSSLVESPILFEMQTKHQIDLARKFDIILCLYCEPAIQRERAFHRKKQQFPTMEDQDIIAGIDRIMGLQLPNEQKISMSHYAIDTNCSPEKVLQKVEEIREKAIRK